MSPLATLVESGTVRVQWKHMFVIGDGIHSLWAAESAECAGDQGHFWAYHDYLFANQAHADSWTRDVLKGYAKDLALDTKTFNQCFDSHKYESKVAADNKEGRSNSAITGTPAYLVNGKLVSIDRSFDGVLMAVNLEVNTR